MRLKGVQSFEFVRTFTLNQRDLKDRRGLSLSMISGRKPVFNCGSRATTSSRNWKLYLFTPPCAPSNPDMAMSVPYESGWSLSRDEDWMRGRLLVGQRSGRVIVPLEDE